MTDKPELVPAADLVPVTADDLQRALSFALSFDGRKRFRRADDLMATITAEHLVKHMQLCGMVVLRKPTPHGNMGVAVTARRED